MTPNDHKMLALVCDTVERQSVMPSDAQLMCILNIAAPYASLKRLEHFGHIVIERYQKGRRIKHVASGRWTATPTNTQTHWRDVPIDTVPRPAVSVVRQHDATISQQIITAATKRGVPVSDFLASLVIIGWMQQNA